MEIKEKTQIISSPSLLMINDLMITIFFSYHRRRLTIISSLSISKS
jgi:hypothetical protein